LAAVSEAVAFVEVIGRVEFRRASLTVNHTADTRK
jgi:hypothetical protein